MECGSFPVRNSPKGNMVNRNFRSVMCVVALGITTYVSSALSDPNALDNNALDAILKNVPSVSHGGSWPYDTGYVRYDTLHRAGNYIVGRFATNPYDACAATQGFTSMPDERSWKKPVQSFHCNGTFDVLYADLTTGGPGSAMSDVKLEPGINGGCDAFQRDVDAHNINTSRGIRATISYHSNGVQSIVVALAPGEVKRDVLYCNYGDAWVSGAYYTN